MEPQRTRPEQILSRIKEEEESASKGRLKIFLGMAAGVGKSYTMLGAAQNLLKEGVDVVAGLVVTHGRIETEALKAGLECLGEREIEYKNTTLKEFDLDAALARKPTIVLVDELAHTNAPGSRHEKRWQDVEELLQAGIDVYTTLNIQHLESVNDVIAQITGVRVRETIPDSIFDKAYEVEVVDLPPDELIQRLHEGKVYVPDQAQTALKNFFNKGNLIALRELALRMTAERVDAQMRKYREATDVQNVWPVADRLLVCVGPSPLSARLVRAAKRMAGRLDAEWMAVYVETPASARLSARDRSRVVRTLALAQRLGAQTDRISGSNPSEELIRYAQRANVTKIVIGKPAKPRWRELLFGSVVDELIRKSGNIDVYVITGDKSTEESITSQYVRTTSGFRHYLIATAVVAVASLIAKLAFHHHLATVNLAMIYMLAVVIIALRYGRGPSMLAAVLSVALFDFLFVPPYLSFAVSDTQYLITFSVMFVVATALSTLASTVRSQAELDRRRERQTAALYAMTRDQATAMGVENIVNTSVRHVCDVFQAKITVLLAAEKEQLQLMPHLQPTFEVDQKEMAVAQWVHLNQRPAGATTSTLAGAKALYLPLSGSSGTIGVIGVIPGTPERLGNPDEMHLLETFVNQMALAVERAQLSERRRLPRRSQT